MSGFTPVSFIGKDGNRTEINPSLNIYKNAAREKISVPQYMNRHYPADTRHGTTFEQVMASTGLFIKGDKSIGLQSPSMKDVLDGTSAHWNAASAITAPDGTDSRTPSGRLFIPAVILEIMALNLEDDKSSFLGRYNQMVAQTVTIAAQKYEQPYIDTSAPYDVDPTPITQLSEPAMLVSITASDTTRTIPRSSVGLTISDEALESSSLDLVSIIMARHIEGKTIRMVENQLKAMVNGDVDTGQTALPDVFANTFDATITADGIISHKAWLKLLMEEQYRRTIDWVIVDIDTLLAIENRTGKPTISTDDPQSPRVDTLLGMTTFQNRPPPQVFVVDSGFFTLDSGHINPIVCLDSRYGIRRVISSVATYDAVERYVMRRATSLRLDSGEQSHRLYDDAWQVVTLDVA